MHHGIDCAMLCVLVAWNCPCITDLIVQCCPCLWHGLPMLQASRNWLCNAVCSRDMELPIHHGSHCAKLSVLVAWTAHASRILLCNDVCSRSMELPMHHGLDCAMLSVSVAWLAHATSITE